MLESVPRAPTQFRIGLLCSAVVPLPFAHRSRQRLGVGLRAPLRLPLGFGVKSGVDTFLWLREQTRWTMSLFAEIDPFYRSNSSE